MDSLGDRMKDYERCYRSFLPKKSHVIIRVDGRAFHTYTKNFNKPFDQILCGAMGYATYKTLTSMQGNIVGYTQSDEASFYITDDLRPNSEPWFGNNVNKIVSISASTFTYYFNEFIGVDDVPAIFDARAFAIPKEDVPNYFVWRQKDWARNFVNMVARVYFSDKELLNKNNLMMWGMLIGKDVDFKPYQLYQYGSFYNSNCGKMCTRNYTYEDLNKIINLILRQKAGMINDTVLPS